MQRSQVVITQQPAPGLPPSLIARVKAAALRAAPEAAAAGARAMQELANSTRDPHRGGSGGGGFIQPGGYAGASAALNPHRYEGVVLVQAVEPLLGNALEFSTMSTK